MTVRCLILLVFFNCKNLTPLDHLKSAQSYLSIVLLFEARNYIYFQQILFQVLESEKDSQVDTHRQDARCDELREEESA